MRPWFPLLLLLVGCPPALPDDITDDGGRGTRALFDLEGDFWDAPFPSDHRVLADTRRVDIDDFPSAGNSYVAGLVELLHDRTQGWPVSGAIWVPFEDAVSAEKLPGLARSTQDDSLVQLVHVDADDPEHIGERVPVEVRVVEGVTTYGPTHAVAASPVAGLNLRPRTRYALLVLADLEGTDGLPLERPRALDQLIGGELPEGWREDVATQYADAASTLLTLGFPMEEVAGMTVFTTGRPTRGFADLVEQGAVDDGIALASGISLADDDAGGVYDDFCAFEGRVNLPVYQRGEPPYEAGEGGIVVGEDGPEVQRREVARLVITTPREWIAGGRYPTVVFVRTGAGGDRPLVDRGPRTEAGVDVPGTGLAGVFARAGWAAVQLDGPLGGIRNPTGGDEQFLIFSVDNPEAMLGNLQQSAMELALVPELLRNLGLPPGLCPGLPTAPTAVVRFDHDDLVIFGHSMGATIAPVSVHEASEYKGMLLSGAGSSWIENIVHKKSPIATAPAAATILGEQVEAIDRFHPALTLLQWAGEPADPMSYAPDIVNAPGVAARHVLMMQGLVDTYIPVPVANALSLSLGLDLAGDALDVTAAPEHRPLQELLPWADAGLVGLPTGLNRDVGGGRLVTAVVTQLPQDDVEDGHEVVFQTDPPKHMISCFLGGMGEDAPSVPDGTFEGQPCPDISVDDGP